MSIPLTVNGSVFNFPAVKEPAGTWAQDMISWATQVSNSTLQLDAGEGLPGNIFAITNELDFGTAEGLRSKSYKIRDTGSAFDITMQAPTLSASYTLTWPVDDGTLDQVLTTDGAGILTWAAAAGGASTFQVLYDLDASATVFDLDAGGSFAVRDFSSNNILLVDEATDRVTVENLSIDALSFILDADEGSGFTGTFRLFGGSPLTAARTYDFPDASGTIAISPTFQNIYDFGAADASFTLDASGFFRIKDSGGNDLFFVDEAVGVTRFSLSGTDYLEIRDNGTLTTFTSFTQNFLFSTSGLTPGEILIAAGTSNGLVKVRNFDTGASASLQLQASGNATACELRLDQDRAVFKVGTGDVKVAFGEFAGGNGSQIEIRGSGNNSGQRAQLVFGTNASSPKTGLISSIVNDTGVERTLVELAPEATATFTRSGSKYISMLDDTATERFAVKRTGGVVGVSSELPITSVKRANDAAPGDVTLETVIYSARNAETLLSVKFLPSELLTADNTNNATLTVFRRDSSGGTQTTVATVTTSVGGTGSWTAFDAIDFGALSATALAADEVLTIEITKAGTGVAVPRGTWQIERQID